MIPIGDLLRLVVEEKASDLHLTVGLAPVLRLRGSLAPLQTDPLSPDQTEALARSLSNETHWERLQQDGTVDFGFSFGESARFRVNIYRQKGCYGAALRLIPNELLSFEQIGLPPAVQQLTELPRGLVLVTGPTGSGKTTSLASMLNSINERRSCHILTIEDPIEYMFTHKRGMINQREIGADVPSFAEGLRRALRQDPDVILVGEMRDLETMEIALTAAETGHLVFSTVHTTGAARTIDRIVDAFPATQQEQIRVQLAGNLRAVLSQLLLPRSDGTGRVAAFELMINTPSIAALIRDNKSYRISTDIQTGSKFGMLSLETSLVDLYSKGLISREEVMAKAQDPQAALQLMAQFKK